jgi:hypothetical protein
MQATQCTLCDNERAGVVVTDSGRGKMQSSTSGRSRRTQAIGAEAGGASTEVELVSCTLHSNSNCAVMAYGGSHARVRGCRSDSNATGYYITAGAVASLSDACTSSGENAYNVQGGRINRTADCTPQ